MTGSTCARSGEKGDPAWRRSIQSKREAPPATRLVGGLEWVVEWFLIHLSGEKIGETLFFFIIHVNKKPYCLS